MDSESKVSYQWDFYTRSVIWDYIGKLIQSHHIVGCSWTHFIRNCFLFAAHHYHQNNNHCWNVHCLYYMFRNISFLICNSQNILHQTNLNIKEILSQKSITWFNFKNHKFCISFEVKSLDRKVASYIYVYKKISKCSCCSFFGRRRHLKVKISINLSRPSQWELPIYIYIYI